MLAADIGSPVLAIAVGSCLTTLQKPHKGPAEATLVLRPCRLLQGVSMNPILIRILGAAAVAIIGALLEELAGD